jgi:virulence-associated protein VapD
MNEDFFKTKTNLDPSDYKKLFGDPFWNKQGKTYIGLAILIILFSVYYHWQNRYVELRPVLVNEVLHRPIFFSETFHNQLFKIAKPNEIPPNFYKNIKWVLEREHQEYIVKNGVIYIRYKYMNDYEMIWNHTTKTNNLEWFKLKREMDSINGDYESKEKLDRIIKGFRD